MDALRRFSSVDSDTRDRLIEAAEREAGVRLEVVDGADPGFRSLGWRIATWAGDSAVAADVFTLKREAPGFVQTQDQPRLACVRQGIHVARMLLQVEDELRKHAGDPADIPISLLNSGEVLTEALLVGSARQVVAYYTLIRKNPPPLGEYLDPAQFAEFVRPVAEAWKQLALRNPYEINLMNCPTSDPPSPDTFSKVLSGLERLFKDK